MPYMWKKVSLLSEMKGWRDGSNLESFLGMRPEPHWRFQASTTSEKKIIKLGKDPMGLNFLFLIAYCEGHYGMI